MEIAYDTQARGLYDSATSAKNPVNVHPRMGENPPKPPLSALGADCALEWGENPPKPPSQRWGPIVP